MNKILFFSLILIMALVWGTNLYFYLQFNRPNMIYIIGSNEPTTTTTVLANVTIITSKRCDLDSDCSWESVNCCQEEAGAYWQCINLNESVIKCVGTILCPQVFSKKPTSSCSCQQGECVG